MEKENSKKLKILALQMSSILDDKWENFSKILELVESNIKKGTDIIILPEVWNVGWKPSLFEDTAEDIENSKTIEFLSEIAQRYKVNIIGGSFISKREGKLYNTCPVINKDGELVVTYDKMHLFSYYGCDEGKYVTKGKNPVLLNYLANTGEIAGSQESLAPHSALPAPTGSNSSHTQRFPLFRKDDEQIKIGLSICYDIRFPEIYRAYIKAGADVLINMAAWPKSRAVHWEALTKARAIENQCFMIALTQSGKIENDEWNLGHSRIIDFNGEVISETKKEDSAVYAEINLEEMYKFREKCTVLLDIHDRYEVK